MALPLFAIAILAATIVIFASRTSVSNAALDRHPREQKINHF
jgi:hypothetical protein